MKQKPRRGLLMQKFKMLVNPCRIMVLHACLFLRLKPEVIQRKHLRCFKSPFAFTESHTNQGFFNLIHNTEIYRWFCIFRQLKTENHHSKNRKSLLSGVPEGRTVNNLRFQPEALLYHEAETPEGFTHAEIQTGKNKKHCTDIRCPGGTHCE